MIHFSPQLETPLSKITARAWKTRIRKSCIVTDTDKRELSKYFFFLGCGLGPMQRNGKCNPCTSQDPRERALKSPPSWINIPEFLHAARVARNLADSLAGGICYSKSGLHIVADTNASPFARALCICCGHKFWVRDTKNVSDFVQKHSVSAANVSHFAQPKKHHGQQCVRNNVSAFTRALINLRSKLIQEQ